MGKLTSLLSSLKNPPRFFVVASVVLSICYGLIVPPFQSPDEVHHLYRIHQISEGQFTPLRNGNRVGGDIPECFQGLQVRFRHISVAPEWKIKVRDLLHTFTIPYSEQGKQFCDFPDTAFYTPVSYLPQALLLFILKHLPVSMGTLYYLLRFFSLFIWIVCMWFCLQNLPVGRWLFVAVLLLPMQIYISGSLSGDLMNNCLCFILTGLSLNRLYRQPVFRWKDVLIFSFLGVLLVFTKLFYAGLLMILLLIPMKNFGNHGKKWLMLGLVLLPVMLTALLRSQFIEDNYMTYDTYDPDFRGEANLQPGADYKAQKQFLMEHPGNLPGIIFRSLSTSASLYLRSYIAIFGRYMGIDIPHWLYIISFAVLIFLAITEINTWRIKVHHRLLFAALGFLIFSLLILSLYLQWNQLKADCLNGFQGRYLFPVFPLFFLSIGGLVKVNIYSRLILPLFLVIVHFYSFETLISRFYKVTDLERTEFLVQEETTAGNHLLTDNDQVKLELRDAVLDTSFKRSGHKSIKIPAWADSTCHYKFDGPRAGDQLQVRAYVKGTNAQFFLGASSKACPNYYFIYDGISFTDKNGWGAVDLVLGMTEDCPDTKLHFYIRNLTNSPVYIDELDFRLWKKKSGK